MCNLWSLKKEQSGELPLSASNLELFKDLI